jgi:CheY-like chemotaxis protein
MKSMFVIDGSQTVARLFAEVFETRGWSVGFSTDGESAMEQLAGNEACDVVLIGFRMSETEGLKLIRFIRALEHRKTTAVMMITQNAQIRSEALAAGADSVLLKPLDMNALVDAVEKLL